MATSAIQDNVFLHPDATAGSSDSGSPLSESEQSPGPMRSPSRLPRLIHFSSAREKQNNTRFNPYARSRKPRASLAVRVDLPRALGPGKTALPTPVSAAPQLLEDYDCASEAEVSMMCGDEGDDKDAVPDMVDTIATVSDDERAGGDEAGPNDSIASYYFSSEAGSLVDSTSTPSITPDSLVLATPVAPSMDACNPILSSDSSDPILPVTIAEKIPDRADVDPTPSALPSTGSLFRFPSNMNLAVDRFPSDRSLSNTLGVEPYSSWSDPNDNLPHLYNAVLRGVRAEDLRAIAADATSEEAAEECISRVAGELFTYAARVAKGEAEEAKDGGGMQRQEGGGGWWFADAWRAWRAPSSTGA